jgi:hypothetical protein
MKSSKTATALIGCKAWVSSCLIPSVSAGSAGGASLGSCCGCLLALRHDGFETILYGFLVGTILGFFTTWIGAAIVGITRSIINRFRSIRWFGMRNSRKTSTKTNGKEWVKLYLFPSLGSGAVGGAIAGCSFGFLLAPPHHFAETVVGSAIAGTILGFVTAWIGATIVGGVRFLIIR